MTSEESGERGPLWFVALPKARSHMASLVARSGPSGYTRYLSGLSNDFVLVGTWRAEQLKHASLPDRDLIVLGNVDPQLDAKSVLLRGDEVSHVVQASQRWAGSYFLVIRIGHRIAILGSRSGSKKLFEVTDGDSRVLASNAAILARVFHRPVARARVAGRLLGAVPGDKRDEPMWDDVRAISGTYIGLRQPETFQEVGEYMLPEAEPLVQSQQDGARLLRQTLHQSILAHRAVPGVVSADVSGLDSAAVFVALQRAKLEPYALTMASRDRGDDDLQWAHRVVQSFGSGSGSPHLVVDGEAIPLFYEGIEPPMEAVHVDIATPTILDLERQISGYPRLAELGMKTHFTGMGGDHLFTAMPTHFLAHRKLRRRERRSARMLGLLPRGARRLEAYRSWLIRIAESVYRGNLSELDGGWEPLPRIAPWLSVTARVEAASRIDLGSRQLAPNMDRHFERTLIIQGTEALIPLERYAALRDIELVSPYFDDAVIDAVLRVDPLLRLSVQEYKPLLTESLSDALPADIRGRRTKGMAVLDEYRGFAGRRDELCRLFSDSALEDIGLIDGRMLREFIERPSHPDFDLADFDQTLAVEIWLRLHD